MQATQTELHTPPQTTAPRGRAPRRQGIFWLVTMPYQTFTPFPHPDCEWIKGQLELPEAGYLHWQFILALKRKGSLCTLTDAFGPQGHYELSRSEYASEYVWKEQTRVPGTQFEFGQKPIQRNQPKDWEQIWKDAQEGNTMAIPASIRLQSYRTIKSIAADFAKPIGMVRTAYVYWGATGTGKSRDAWTRAGMDAYPKDPRSKFWCGYRGQKTAVIDEFRGGIDISHMLRWLDRYPVMLEIKGSSTVHAVETFYITSNVDPRAWYPELDSPSLQALLRRLTITHYPAFL